MCSRRGEAVGGGGGNGGVPDGQVGKRKIRDIKFIVDFRVHLSNNNLNNSSVKCFYHIIVRNFTINANFLQIKN